MNDDDLCEMSELYSNIRKAVYEDATRPMLNSPEIHRMNKERFKARVEKLCDEAGLEKYSGNDEKTATAIWHHLWTKNRYAGTKSQIATTTEINDIKDIFDDYEQFSHKDWSIETSGHKVIAGGSKIYDFLNRKGIFMYKQTVGDIPKLVKIVSIARLFNDFMNNKNASTPIINFINNGHSDKDVWSIHKHLIRIGYRSNLTALHLMMSLGFAVIKPDLAIFKMFLNLGWLNKIIPSLPKDLGDKDLSGTGKYGQRFRCTDGRMYKPIINLAREIISKTRCGDLKNGIGWETRNPMLEFNIFIVKYGQKPEKEFGIERTLYRGSCVGDKNVGSCLINI